MAITKINLTDAVSAWVTKTNTIASNLGDLALLATGDSNLIDALNQIDSDLGRHADLFYGESDGVRLTVIDAINRIVDSDGNVKGTLDSDIITGDMIQDDTIDSDKYMDSSIRGAFIQEKTIEAKHIADSSITNLHLNGAVIATHNLFDSSISTHKLIDSSITYNKFFGMTTLLVKDSNGDVLKTMFSPGT